MYYYTINATPIDGITSTIHPIAIVTYLDGTTERVDIDNTVDELNKVSWTDTSISVLPYDPYTQINYIHFGFLFTSDAATANDTYSSLMVAIQYNDGTYYKSSDWLSTYGDLPPGDCFGFTCVRYKLT